MDTDAQLPERDPSPQPGDGQEEGSRSSHSEGGVRTARRADGGGPWRRTALFVGICAGLLALLSAFVVQPFLVPSGSMEKTIREGDRVLVNKLAYRFGGEPRRGDVVVFDGTGSFVDAESSGNPVTRLLRKGAAAVGLAEPDETDYIKRVVGVGGDRVTCCDKRGRIKVNGQPVDEDYLYPGDDPSRVRFDIAVPDGRLWVLGDHRSDSRDSRDHLGGPGGGMVPVDRVIGRADWIGWPTARWSTLERPTAFDHVPVPAVPAADGVHG